MGPVTGEGRTGVAKEPRTGCSVRADKDLPRTVFRGAETPDVATSNILLEFPR